MTWEIILASYRAMTDFVFSSGQRELALAGVHVVGLRT